MTISCLCIGQIGQGREGKKGGMGQSVWPEGENREGVHRLTLSSGTLSARRNAFWSWPQFSSSTLADSSDYREEGCYGHVIV